MCLKIILNWHSHLPLKKNLVYSIAPTMVAVSDREFPLFWSSLLAHEQR